MQIKRQSRGKKWSQPGEAWLRNADFKLILTHRQAISMESIPPRLPWAPLEVADKPEEGATIPVAVI